MARRREQRYAWVDIGPDEIETIDRGRIRILLNPPMKSVNQLDPGNIKSITEFLKETVVEWEGFDLPCNEEGFGELDIQEVQQLTAVVTASITNPPSATSETG